MTAILSTRLDIPYFAGEVELAVDYDYDYRKREITVGNCFADIGGIEIDAWHHLSQLQRFEIERQCKEDYAERMESVSQRGRVEVGA